MGLNVNGNRPVEQARKIEETMQKAVSQESENQKAIVPANTDSKLGESDLYGLLRKGSLLKSWNLQPSDNVPYSRPLARTTSVETTLQPLSPVSNQKPVDKNIQLVETSALNVIGNPLKRSDLGILPATGPVPDDGSLTMGNPSGATDGVNNPLDYLMEKPQYALSYNRDRGIPNWTSWHLDARSLGSTGRQNNFRPDNTLPANWYHVTPGDYSGSGYDRGHMTPSGDRTKNETDNSATFLMTNMIPQAPKNNQQTWASLENYCRSLVKEGKELYIVAGGQGTKDFIGNGHVAVPEKTWKVILVQPEGTNDLSRVTADTRVIAVYIPNSNDVASDWKKYRVSADYIEAQTGYNFFSNVPDEIQNAIESKVDSQ